MVACNNKNQTNNTVDASVNKLVLRAQNMVEFKKHLLTINKINDRDVDVILKNGNYRDASVTVDFTSSSSFKKKILAETPGKVTIDGQIYFGLTGKNITVEGFNIIRKKTYGKATPFIAFKDSENCAVRNCSFKENQTELAKEVNPFAYYVIFKEGFRNIIDNCRFEEKHTEGSYIVMNYVSKKGKKGNHHIIENNYFGERAYTDRPSDTALRLGGSGRWDAETAHIDVGLTVKNNVFDNYDAYYETISVKSAGNSFIGNTFIGCNGYLCLRNASNCLIKGNRFIGRNELGTRGVRIQGPNHQIRNNYFQDLSGAAVWIWGGNGKLNTKPTKENPMPLYINTENVTIEQNSIINCQYPIKLTFLDQIKNTVLPQNITVKDNLIATDNKTVKIVYVEAKGCSPNLGQLENNINCTENIIDQEKQIKSDILLFKTDKNTFELGGKLKYSKEEKYYYHSKKKKTIGYSKRKN